MIAVEHLAEVLVEITDTLVDDFDPIEFLELVTTRSASMSHSASAGLLLADPEGRLQFTAASKQSAQLMELFRLQNEEGPWLDCFSTGAPVVNTDLAQAGDRWPVFAPNAVRAGFRSVHAFPLRHRKDVIGALNLFSSHTGQLEPRDVRVIQALADIATIGLLQERSLRDGELTAAQLQRSLSSRITGEQAKGALARKHGVSVDDASALIRGHAVRTNQSLDDVAEAVVADPELIPATDPETLLKPAEVAAMFRVDPKTITRWARAGQLTAIHTLGGHRRYLYSEVSQLLKVG